MSYLIDLAIRNARLTISILLFLLLSGGLAYQSIPKEAEPDIQIPIIYVSMGYSGISPEDSERLRRKALIGGGYLLADRIRERLNFSASREPGLAVAQQDIRCPFDKGDWTGGSSAHHRHLFSF